MSEKKGFENLRFERSWGDIRRGAVRYVDVMTWVWEQNVGPDVISVGKELQCMGYALGVFAGKYSDFGIEGFTLALSGVSISLKGENRKEEIHFAIWDINGNLHTSEEGFRTEKGGEQ